MTDKPLTLEEIERLWMELRYNADPRTIAITHLLEPLTTAAARASVDQVKGEIARCDECGAALLYPPALPNIGDGDRAIELFRERHGPNAIPPTNQTDEGTATYSQRWKSKP